MWFFSYSSDVIDVIKIHLLDQVHKIHLINPVGWKPEQFPWRRTSRKLVLDDVCWSGKATDVAHPPKLGARKASMDAFLRPLLCAWKDPAPWSHLWVGASASPRRKASSKRVQSLLNGASQTLEMGENNSPNPQVGVQSYSISSYSAQIKTSVTLFQQDKESFLPKPGFYISNLFQKKRVLIMSASYHITIYDKDAIITSSF